MDRSGAAAARAGNAPAAATGRTPGSSGATACAAVGGAVIGAGLSATATGPAGGCSLTAAVCAGLLAARAARASLVSHSRSPFGVETGVGFATGSKGRWREVMQRPQVPVALLAESASEGLQGHPATHRPSLFRNCRTTCAFVATASSFFTSAVALLSDYFDCSETLLLKVFHTRSGCDFNNMRRRHRCHLSRVMLDVRHLYTAAHGLATL
jgi:hypothetical protein